MDKPFGTFAPTIPKITTFLSIVLLSISTPVLSQEKSIYNQCIEKNSPINNSVVSLCASEDIQNTEKTIEQYYQQIYQQISEDNIENAKKFAKSHQAWKDYRDAHCELAGQYIGSPMYDYCPMQMNQNRIKQLVEMLE